MLSDKILNGRYKGKAALHDHTVLYNGSKDKIHVHDGLEYTTGVHRSGKIEEYQVIVAFQFAGNLCGCLRRGSDDRIGLTGTVFKLTTEKSLVILAFSRFFKSLPLSFPD